jgi:hypothetical protein
MKYASLLSALALVLSLGCDDVDVVTPDTPQLATGSWEGGTVSGFLQMVLVEDLEGEITGSGFFRTGGLRRDMRTIAFDVTGANVFPDVSLSLQFHEVSADSILGAQLVNYTAEFDASDDELSLFGRLNGGTLRDAVLRIKRE